MLAVGVVLWWMVCRGFPIGAFLSNFSQHEIGENDRIDALLGTPRRV
jgi:hypothetical protein